MKAQLVLKIAGWIVVGLVAVVAIALALGFAVAALWNWLMPTIFGLPTLTYWQAVGLIVLCHILFKGHGDHHEHHARRDKHIRQFRSKVKAMVETNGTEVPQEEAPQS
jgi:hypothetical protein